VDTRDRGAGGECLDIPVRVPLPTAIALHPRSFGSVSIVAAVACDVWSSHLQCPFSCDPSHTHPPLLSQNSSAPRSSYARPLITGIAVQLENGSFSNDTAALLSIESQGGRLIAVYGDYFGPQEPNLVSGLIGEGIVFGAMGA
jgi:hypothetical protein